MDFINKIGQRNCAKILVLLAGCTCFLGFMFESNPNLKKVAFGVILFLLPNLILSLTANKNKDYRLFSLGASAILLVLNNLLFFANFKLILFLALLIQIIATSVFYFFVHNLESRKRAAYRNKKRRVKMAGANTKEISKEETLNPDTEISDNV